MLSTVNNLVHWVMFTFPYKLILISPNAPQKSSKRRELRLSWDRSSHEPKSSHLYQQNWFKGFLICLPHLAPQKVLWQYSHSKFFHHQTWLSLTERSLVSGMGSLELQHRLLSTALAKCWCRNHLLFTTTVKSRYYVKSMMDWTPP